MSVSIKVAVRCRPFTIDDNLGVQMTQRTEEEGEASTRFKTVWIRFVSSSQIMLHFSDIRCQSSPKKTVNGMVTQQRTYVL